MKLKTILNIFTYLFFVNTITTAQKEYKKQKPIIEYTATQQHTVTIYNPDSLSFAATPKNIILFIGDGMGLSQVFAGLTANGGNLNLLNMTHIGFSRTQSADSFVTDSGAGGTAIATGHKTNNGTIGLDRNNVVVPNMVEIAELHQKATGLVATSSITHATPASFIAHQESRKQDEDIAADFLKTDVDVFIGGGSDFFMKRDDHRNLVQELKDKNYQVAFSMDEAELITNGKLAVFTAENHNPDYTKRGNMLEEATSKAITVLKNHEGAGFFLMVEGSQIDWGGHANDVGYICGEVLDLDKAIGQALKFAVQDKNTLVIVTADHETSGLSLHDGNFEKGYVKASFTRNDHTGVMVPVYAFGPGAKEFQGFYENTVIFQKMIKLFGF